MKTTAILAAACFMMIPLANCADTPAAPKPHRVGKYFEVAIPAGWTEVQQYLGLSQDEKKVYGVNLTGPEAGRAMAAHYYAPDNLLDKTAAKFIKVHSTPAVKGGPAGPKVKGGKVGGLPARLFGAVTYESSKPQLLLHSQEMSVTAAVVGTPGRVRHSPIVFQTRGVCTNANA